MRILQKLQQCGYVQENYQKMDFTEENSFDTVYVMERQMPVEKILAGMKKSLQIRPGGSLPDQRIYAGGKWQLDRGQCNSP